MIAELLFWISVLCGLGVIISFGEMVITHDQSKPKFAAALKRFKLSVIILLGVIIFSIIVLY